MNKKFTGVLGTAVLSFALAGMFGMGVCAHSSENTSEGSTKAVFTEAADAAASEEAAASASSEAAGTSGTEISAADASSEDASKEASTGVPDALTPDGNADLVDNATDKDGKLFYTFKTKNGNYFYVVVDEAKEADNVYVMDLVDEKDLEKLIAEADKNSSTSAGLSGSSYSLNSDSAIGEPDADENADEGSTAAASSAAPVPAAGTGSTGGTDSSSGSTGKSSGNGAAAAGIGIVLLIGGVFLYFKVLKPNKDKPKLKDDLDFLDDEDYENEDEKKDPAPTGNENEEEKEDVDSGEGDHE